MAKGLYRQHMVELGHSPQVASAGLLPGGSPAPPEVVEVMARRGVDLMRHRSRRIDPKLLAQADLTLTMTRQQLVEVAAMAGVGWTRCFTLAEVVRRGEAVGPRVRSESEARWVDRVHGDRQRSGLLALPREEDVPDPINGRRVAYLRTAETLAGLIERLVLLVGEPGP